MAVVPRKRPLKARGHDRQLWVGLCRSNNLGEQRSIDASVGLGSVEAVSKPWRYDLARKSACQNALYGLRAPPEG
jgi:hypothetical protein